MMILAVKLCSFYDDIAFLNLVYMLLAEVYKGIMSWRLPLNQPLLFTRDPLK